MSSIAPDWLYRPAHIIVFALGVSYATTVFLHYLGVGFAPDFIVAALAALVFVLVVLSYDQYRYHRD
jgi:hypothetical protein